jgi:very-short-patch-repair endonuclease
MAQRDAIEMELERLRRASPSTEAFFDEDRPEPFFVKNLENVQGDERDVIFVSVGYGRTAQGHMTMSFGPLNRDGGERRLNVLISRSRLAMDVFSNFTAADLDMSRSSARGVAALQRFLHFAETGHLESPYSTSRGTDSPFEESVFRELSARGVEIEPQVGTAGFFIDLAVKDPAYPGRYVLGIECDGASYHSARSARDRDRLRQEVLEGLGWRFHRIWSTDWYRNREGEIDRALQAVEAARASVDQPSTERVTVPFEATSNDVPRAEPSEVPSDAVATRPYSRAELTISLKPAFGFCERQLHELPSEELAEWVLRIVLRESPVHRMSVAQRITQAAGLSRTGGRIQQAVDTAIGKAVSRREIFKKGDFLWSPMMVDPPVRDRSSLDISDRRPDRISPEEYEASVLEEVNACFSVSPDLALQGAARRLGFARMSEQLRRQLDEAASRLVQARKVGHVDGRFVSI